MTLVRHGSIWLTLFSLGSLAVSTATADTISTWNGGAGNWSTAAQWTPSRAPNNTAGQSYDVSIGSGTVSFDTNATINSLSLSGSLETGYNYDPLYAQSIGLGVNGNATVASGGGFGGDTLGFFNLGFFNPFHVGGNLTNAGGMIMGGAFNVDGNVVNSGNLTTIGAPLSSPAIATVRGNFSNSGNVVVGTEGQNIAHLGPSTLNVIGTFTNQANGSLNITNPQPAPSVSLTAQTLINDGTASFQAGTTSTFATLINNGKLNIFGDVADNIGQLTVGTLEPVAGVVQVWDTVYPHLIGPGIHSWDVSSPLSSGGALIVGSGTVPSGFSGYYQFANGILDEAGGFVSVYAPIYLNGTLDILLSDGYKPVGTVFTVIEGGLLTGTFSNVEGLVFDGGRERYVLDYESHYVDLIVENNTTPEPRSIFLTSLAFFALLAFCIARKRA